MKSKIVDKILTQARIFYEMSKGKAKYPKLGPTFGYFLDHPFSALNKKRLASILDYSRYISRKLGKPIKIVDFACGGGLVSSALSYPKNFVVGVDCDQDELLLAKLFVKQSKIARVKYLRADLVARDKWETNITKLLKGKPDVAVLAYALHHLPAVEKFIHRLSNYMPKNSYLIINEENYISPTFRLKHFIRTHLQKDTDVEHQRSYRQWKDILERNNFTIIESSMYDLIPMPEDLRWSMVILLQKTS
ncbi:MAG: class I SAM-dependent methyltransferase [bacterium]